MCETNILFFDCQPSKVYIAKKATRISSDMQVRKVDMQVRKVDMHFKVHQNVHSTS